MSAAPQKPWRQRLGPVHTWVGIVLGGLLFAVFWMGTLSVFDREIDRWMMPATRLASPPGPTRLASPAGPPRLDAIAPLAQSLVPAGARQWRVDWATPRTPVLRLSWQTRDGQRELRYLDPATLAPMADPGTLGASGFFFPFHYGLMLSWNDLGKWLVGLAGMAMLVLLVSGVVIHRKLFADFFTFRPRKRLPRSSLDLHNVTGVLGLPFHFLITLSGLVIFWAVYFPQAHQGVYGSGAKAKAAVQAEGYGRYRPSPDPQAKAQPLASLDAMADQARARWGLGAEPYFVRVWKPGQADSYVELRRSYASEVSMNLDQLYFDAATGQFLHQFQAAPAMAVQRFFSGLHFIQFEHPLLRGLYFALGLSGCVLIATGQVFWLAARRKAAAPDARWRLVEALAVASTTGLIAATLGFLCANRLLPQHAQWGATDRPGLELLAFFVLWSLALAHGLGRAMQAWREQAWAIAALAASALLLNAVTTDAYTRVTTPWAVWGVDAALLALAATAIYAARRLKARGLAT
ncbi:MAG: PepSY-associated TM helix domain-containing protein [Comamonas sp.]